MEKSSSHTRIAGIVLLALTPPGSGQDSRAQSSRKVEPNSLIARVDAFHAWFGTRAARYAEAFSTPERDRVESIGEETGKAFERWLPGIDWTYGPGSAPGSHRLNLSPGSSHTAWFLGKVWASRARKTPRWEFRVGKQPEPVDGLSFTLEERAFDCDRARVQAVVDEAASRIRVRVYHPLFAKCTRDVAELATFLFLDAALGEAKVETCIGAVETTKRPLQGETVALSELLARVEELALAKGWPTDATPDQLYRVVEGPAEEHGDVPRADIVTLRTRVPELAEGDADEVRACVSLAAGMGAAHVFLRVDAGRFDPKQALAKRDELEAIVARALAGETLGTCVGAATGKQSCYFDLLLYEPATAIAALKDAFAATASVTWAELHPFDAAEHGQSLALKGSRRSAK